MSDFGGRKEVPATTSDCSLAFTAEPFAIRTLALRELTLGEPVVFFTEHGDRVTIPAGTVLRVSESVT